jgi:hypothetical protein
MSKTPTSVMVVSILGIIYGIYILLATPCGIFMIIHPIMPNPMLETLTKDATYITFVLCTSIIQVCMGVLLLAASIGSLKLKPWARTGMNTYAVIKALFSLVGTVISLVFVLPRMTTAMAATPPGPAGPFAVSFAPLVGTFAIVGAILGLLLGWAVSTVILITFNRRIAVDAFHGIFPVEPTNFPVQFPPPPPDH